MATYTIGGFTRTSAPTSSSPEILQDDAETKPSQVSKDYWLYEKSNFPNTSPANGKWMLFYLNKDIDAAWIKAKTLMRKGMRY